MSDTQDPKEETLDLKDWKNTIIPETVRKDPVFEKYQDPGEAMTALVEAQKFLGREKLPVPKDANDTETFNLIYKRLGLPENGDGYVLPTDLQIPQELPLDEAIIKEFKTEAHKLGILPHQFGGIYKWYMGNVIKQYNQQIQQRDADAKEAETALRKEWGAAYRQNIELAKKVFHNFADEKAMAEVEKGIGNNSAFLKLFAEIGKVLSEDQLAGKPGGFTMTPDEAQTAIDNIKSDKNHAYWKAEDPGHEKAVDYMNRLIKLTEA